MSDLTKQNNSEIVKFTPLLYYNELNVQDIELAQIPSENKRIILASLNNPKIKFMGDSEVRDGLIDTLALVIWESGFKFSQDPELDAKEQKTLINYMIEVIRVEYSNLSLEEIKIALLKGVRNKYGDVYGLNVRMMCIWLDAFIEDKKQIMLTLPKPKKEEEAKKELTEEQIKENRWKWLNYCINSFEEYKEKGETDFFDFGNSLYNYIRYSMRLVDLTKEETDDIWVRAIGKYKNENSIENARNVGNKIDLKTNLERLEKGEASAHEKVRMIARRMALPKLFEKIKIANIDFRKRIEEHEAKLEKEAKQKREEENKKSIQ